MTPEEQQKATLAQKYYLSGEIEQAIMLLEPLYQNLKDNAFINYYLGICYFDANKQKQGLALIEKAHQLEPNNVTYIHNLGSMYRLNSQLEKAQNFLEQAVALSPENAVYLGNLCNLYHDLNLNNKAREVGIKCLQIKNIEAQKIFDAHYRSQFSLQTKNTLKGYQNGEVNIIAFSLWGDNPLYTHGAIINAMIAPYLYPEWITRFYFDSSVPKDIRTTLERLAGQTVFFEQSTNNYRRLLWRFLTPDYEGVTRFICRDCDSRLNIREKLAVDEWVHSGKPFHIMRDAYENNELILAGMWGGVAGVLPNMAQMIELYQSETHQKWVDQNFLKDVIWPMIKDEAFTHDDYFGFYKAHKFPPVIRNVNDPKSCVGGRELWDLNRIYLG